jgi:DNA relaxase NicK
MWPESSTLVDVGVDYFTTTSTQSDISQLLLQKGALYVDAEEKLGFDVKGWNMFGYSGFRAGRVETGERGEGGIVRLSSVLAACYWWDLFQITGRCSRIDLQVTWRCAGDVNHEIKRAEDYVSEFFRGRNDGPTQTVWYDSRGGRTLYLGKRQSGAYCRIYNKAAESGEADYEGCLRLEVEYKNRYSVPVVDFLLGSETVQHGICLCLGNYAHDRGIPTNLATNSLRPSCRPIAATDALSKLRWLHESVSSTCFNLCSSGRVDEVIQALKLGEFVQRKYAGLDWQAFKS